MGDIVSFIILQTRQQRLPTIKYVHILQKKIELKYCRANRLMHSCMIFVELFEQAKSNQTPQIYKRWMTP
jgi:hypothetical protein